MRRWPALGSILFLGALQEGATSFQGTFDRLRALVEQGDVEAARALCEPLFSAAKLDEPERAALHFGLGLVSAQSDDHALWPDAAEEFQSARALAGAGELRLDATYDAGVVELQEGERLRAQIPEVAQASGAGPSPGMLQSVPPPVPIVPPGGPAGSGPGAPAEEQDPLAGARAAYERARGTLCDRLRADWRDADTRANLELVQRRLHELDLIERRRQEQQEKEQADQQGQDQEDKQDPQGDPKDQDKSQEDKAKQDQDSKGEEQQDPEGEHDPEEKDPSGEEQQQPQPDPAAEDPNAKTPQELEPPAGEEQAQGTPQAQDGERHLTREEVMRLLDQLAELEAQGRAVEARLRQARREAVERDW